MNDTRHLVVSASSLDSDDPYDVIYSVISYVNVVLEEGGELTDLHPDAHLVYAVDYYLAQILNGGFSQFVYNTRWDEQVITDVTRGLEAIGATEHAAHFARQRERIASPGVAAGLEDFYASPYFGDNAFRDMLDENDDAFAEINERSDLIEVNSAFVRSHPDLTPQTIPEMFARAEAIVGHPIDREG